MNIRSYELRSIQIFIVSVFAILLSGFAVADQSPGIVLAQSSDPVFVGAGDISNCSRTQDEETAKLLDNISGTVFTLGDNAYPDGTASQFSDCYGPTWGRHKNRTKPVPGNHDYHVNGASAYYNYFGAAAGDPGKGYYSYNLGMWHIIASIVRSPKALAQPRSNGCGPIWLQTRKPAPWRIGTNRALAPANMATLPLLKHFGRPFMITGQT